MAPFRSVTTTAAHGAKRKIRPFIAHSFLCSGRPALQQKQKRGSTMAQESSRAA